MLSLLTRLLLPLSLLCAALLTVAMLSGRLMPLPEHASLLTNNSCSLPCVFGVVPRITSRNDALKAFENIALRTTVLETLPEYDQRGSRGTQSLLALLDLSDTEEMTVRSVTLYQLDDRRDLGVLSDFLLAGYQPTHVYSRCASTDRLIIVLNETGLFIQITLNTRVDPDARVLIFGTTGGSDGLPRALETFSCVAISDWSGVAALWKYTLRS